MEQELPEEAIAVNETEIPAGRQITPVGPMYLAAQKAISLMTDNELKTHIMHYKELVRASERNLDYRRTVLANAQNELETRETAQNRRLRGVRVVASGIKISINAKADAKNKWDGVISKLRATGKTDAEISQMLQDLQALVQRSNKEKV